MSVIDPAVSGYHIGDCRELLARLPEGCVQTCVTSPPYWGLRDYGVEGQIGHEETPEQYVSALVDVFRGVRRALRDDGTLWLNLGDSYAMSTKGSSGKGDKQRSNAGTLLDDRRWRIPQGLKPKDLVGIPWMTAFALRADGWYLRSDIIWSKPNPMPESVTDRPTKSHEYLFLLSKSANYFYDKDAVAEPSTWAGQNRSSRAPAPTAMPGAPDHRGFRQDKVTGTRNLRSVWRISPRPYAGAHFAVMPPALVEPCILAGSRPGDLALDPFLGSGTVAMVAQQHRRRWIGLELNPEYARLVDERLRVPMLALKGVA